MKILTESRATVSGSRGLKAMQDRLELWRPALASNSITELLPIWREEMLVVSAP